MKRVVAALAAAVLAVSLVPASLVEAASKTSVNLVAKSYDVNDGTSVKYSYNKMGLVSKSVYTSKSTEVDKVTIEEGENSESTDDGDEYTSTTTYDLYGYATTTNTNKVKEVVKYTYNTKGKAKGQIKKKTTTYTTVGTYKEKYDTNDSAYDTANSGGYKETYKVTGTVKYYYNKKGVLTKMVTKTKSPSYATYSSLSGYYAADNPAGSDTVYANGVSFKNDYVITTTTVKFKTKNGKVVKTVASMTEQDYDSEYDGYSTVLTVHNYDYSDTVTKFTYKDGYVKKSVVKDTNTTTDNCVVTSDDGSSYTETSSDDYNDYNMVYKYTYNKNHTVKNVSVNRTEYQKLYKSVIYEEIYDDVANSYLYNTTYSGLSYLKSAMVTKSSYQYKFKGDSARMTQKLIFEGTTLSADGKDDSGTVSLIKYSLNSKKLSSTYAKLAEQQQYIIQNGNLNGVYGL